MVPAGFLKYVVRWVDTPQRLRDDGHTILGSAF